MIKTYVLILLLICCLPTSSRAQEFQWKKVDGFYGDRIKFAHNDTFLFAISYESGVYRTADKGVTMEEVNTGLPNGMPKNRIYRISAITIHNGYVIIGTDSGRIYRSTNNGDSWVEVSKQLVGKNIHAFGRVGDVLFAGTERGVGIYKSTDYGDTWTESYNNPENNVINSFATIGTTIIAGGRYLIRSTDYGATWTDAFSEYGLGISKLTANSTTFFASTNTTGMIRGDNDGTLWSDINTGIDASSGPSIMSTYATDNRVFAGTFSEIYQSTDKGESWKNISNNLSGGAEDFATIGSTIFVGSNVILRAELPVSVQESAMDSDFSIFPNPADDIVKVMGSGTGILAVRDVLGRVIIEKAHSLNTGTLISTRDMPTGVYIVEYNQNSGKRTLQSLVIHK